MFKIGDKVCFNGDGATLYYLTYGELPPKKLEIISTGRNLHGRATYFLKYGPISGWWSESYLQKAKSITLISAKRIK